MTASREWCAYVRVSKVGGREGTSFHSPAEQEERIKRSTTDPVPMTFTDLDVSGGTWVRQGFDDALAWMRMEPTRRGMIVMDIDRFGRDLVGAITLLRQLASEGLVVRVLADNVSTTDDGFLVWTIKLAMAEEQRRKIGERWKSIQSRRREKGLPSGGGARFGYRLENGIQVPDAVTGPFLRQAYLDYTAGTGYQALVNRLNEQGIRSTRGGLFTTHTLRRVLDSGFGAGLLVLSEDRNKFLQGVHEPVITEDEWQAFRRARDRRRALPSKVRTPRWYLSGLVRCGSCGGTMTVAKLSDADASIVCSTYKNAGRSVCAGAWAPRWMVEHVVTNWVGSHVEEVTAHAWDASARDEARQAVERRLHEAEDRLQKAQEGLARLARGYASGLLDEAAVVAAKGEIELERAAAMGEVAEVHVDLERLAPADADVYDRLIGGTEDMSPSVWGALLGRVLREVRVYQDEFLLVPVVGDPVTRPRPPRRPGSHADQARSVSGRFLRRVDRAAE